MGSDVRKCIGMGLGGITSPFVHQQNLKFTRGGAYPDVPGTYASDNMRHVATSGTRWVRLMLNVLEFWPSSTSDPLAPGTMNNTYMLELDYQLALAKSYGCGTLLTIGESLPGWINRVPGSPRTRPQDMSSSSPFAQLVWWLAARYNLYNPNRPWGGYSQLDVLEVFNEPNIQWTARAGGDAWASTADCVAAGMKTAKQMVANLNGAPLIGAPSVLDTDSEGYASSQYYYNFTASVASRLNSNGFWNVTLPNGGNMDGSVVWTIHNYADVIYDHGASTTAPDKSTRYPTNSARARTVLRSKRAAEYLQSYGWKGWGTPAGSLPRVFVTEGGADVQRVASVWLSGSNSLDPYASDYALRYYNATIWQNYLADRNWQRVSNDSEGRSVAMLTSYLTYSDHRGGVFGDAGLCNDTYGNQSVAGTLNNTTYYHDPYSTDNGNERPLLGTWKGYPGRL